MDYSSADIQFTSILHVIIQKYNIRQGRNTLPVHWFSLFSLLHPDWETLFSCSFWWGWNRWQKMRWWQIWLLMFWRAVLIFWPDTWRKPSFHSLHASRALGRITSLFSRKWVQCLCAFLFYVRRLLRDPFFVSKHCDAFSWVEHRWRHVSKCSLSTHITHNVSLLTVSVTRQRT